MILPGGPSSGNPLVCLLSFFDYIYFIFYGYFGIWVLFHSKGVLLSFSQAPLGVFGLLSLPPCLPWTS